MADAVGSDEQDMIMETPQVLHMLSTIDNPYNPFTQWDEWLAFDTSKGYNSMSYLARVARVSDEMSEPDYDIQLEQAILDIVNQDVLNLYIRVPEPEKQVNTTDV